jgi:hypothetical protein
MLAEGKYRARAVEWSQVTQHEKTGNEEIRALFEIADGELKGQTITWRGYFTEGTAERTVESLRYMGWAGDDITDIQGLSANEVQIVIKHEEWEGKMQAKVAWVNRANNVYMGTPMDAARKTAFANRMKGLVVSSKQNLAKAPVDRNGEAPGDFNFGHNVPPGQGGQGSGAGLPFPEKKAGGVKL